MAYSKEEAAQEIIAAGMSLVKQGLIARTWGNISARISDTEFMITPSGMAYDRLTPDKLVICKIEDCSYEGNIKPSSEKGVHGEAYKYRKDINFVIHTHQLYATAAGALGKSLSCRNKEDESILGDNVYSAKYAISSTKPLMRNVSAEIQKHRKSNAFFMRFHGVLCLGRDNAHAFAVSQRLEDMCREKICTYENMDASSKLGFPESLSQERIRKEVQRKHVGAVVGFDQSPCVKRMAETGKRVYPMIDDMAQIAGRSFACLDPGDKKVYEKIQHELTNKACVFIKDQGAIYSAKNAEEAVAVRMVLEKNCLAGAYCAEHGVFEHLSGLDAGLQRMVYVKKYAKLK